MKKTKPVDVDLPAGIVEINKRKKEKRLSKRQLKSVIKKQKKIIQYYPWVKKWYGFSFSEDLITRESYCYNESELKELSKKGYPFVTWVEQGQQIGNAGTSAVIWGGIPYSETSSTPRIDPFETWDEVHLHFEEAARDPQTFVKTDQRDPYDLYLSRWCYTKRKIKRTLFEAI